MAVKGLLHRLLSLVVKHFGYLRDGFRLELTKEAAVASGSDGVVMVIYP